MDRFPASRALAPGGRIGQTRTLSECPVPQTPHFAHGGDRLPDPLGWLRSLTVILPSPGVRFREEPIPAPPFRPALSEERVSFLLEAHSARPPLRLPLSSAF